MNIDKIFTYSPELEQLTQFAQFEATIQVPTRTGLTDVKFLLLWEGELQQIIEDSSKGIDHGDMLARSGRIRIETLVRAIHTIGTEKFSSDDKDEEYNLKNKLRSILQVSSPILVKYIYDRYNDLNNRRSQLMEPKFEDLKKNFLEQLENIQPL